MRYYPADEEIKAAAPGRVLVHNHVTPLAEQSGTRSFRAWDDEPAPQYVVCDCGWRPELGIHYRVSGTLERSGQC